MSNKCQINQTETIKQAILHLLQRLLFQSAPLLELLGCRCASSYYILLLLQAAGGHLGLLVLLLPLGLQQPSLPQSAVRLVLERAGEGRRKTMNTSPQAAGLRGSVVFLIFWELFPFACFGM